MARVYGFFFFPLLIFCVGFFLVKSVASVAVVHPTIRNNPDYADLSVLQTFWRRVLFSFSLAGVTSGGLLGLYVNKSFAALSQYRSAGTGTPRRVNDELKEALYMAAFIGAACGLLATVILRFSVDLSAVWNVAPAYFHGLGIAAGAAAAALAARFAY